MLTIDFTKKIICFCGKKNTTKTAAYTFEFPSYLLHCFKWQFCKLLKWI